MQSQKGWWARVRSWMTGPVRSKRSRRVLLEDSLEARVLLAAFTPGNLALLVAGENDSNSPGSIVEINTTSANQTAVQTIPLPDTSNSADSFRISGSASSTGYVARSNDRTLLSFTGHNSTNTSSNANTLNPRGVYTVNPAGIVAKQTTYTGSSGNQTRGATSLNNTNWFIGDQGGLYTNDSTAASPTGNFRSVKSFGGTVYGFTASTSFPPVGTFSAVTGASFTGLPGLPNGASSRQDFYLIQSGSSGTTYDVLYVLDSTAGGTIFKYSLVNGSWTANGTYLTNFGGFGLASEDRDATNATAGAFLYVSSGSGATTANTVRRLTDAAGYNATIDITTASNVTLYTAATGTLIKGLDFVPVSTTASPAVTSSGASSVTASAAALNGNVTSDGGATITERGFVYSLTSENSNPQIGGANTTKVTVSGTTGVFSGNITGLSSSTGYSFVAYAINSAGTGYSTVQTFTTQGDAVLPSINSPTVTDITISSATLGGNVTSDGNSPITARGIVYSLTSVNPNPALGGTGTTTLTDPATTTGVFTIPASGLNAGAEYSFVAYVTNGVGTSYTSPVSTFTTLALPTLGALSLPNVFDTLALAGSSVVADGGTPVTGRGFVISATAANSNPQLGGTGVTEIAGGSGTGVFSRSIGPLLPATEYSVAAYATSAAGTAYTAVSTFTTAAGPTTSLAAGDLAFTGYNGTTTPERISFVLLKSVAIGTSVLLTDNGWNEAVAPPAFNTNEGLYQLGFAQDFPAGSRFFYDSATVSFTDFSGSATGLISRATGNPGFSNSGDQLTAIQGTLAAPSAFLAQISSGAFVTSGTPSTQTTYLAPGLAVGTTAISLNAANGNGVLNSADADVGTTIVDTAAGIRGIVNAVSNWTVNTSSTLVVPPDISFSVTPTVTVSAATDVTDSTATLNGSAVSAGQSEITERGFVYSLTSANNSPRIGGTGTTQISVSGSLGDFNASIGSLSASSDYSFVAYAINSAGTGYSTVQTFTTQGDAVLPSINSPTVTDITISSATLGGNVTSDGNSPITARGIVYSLTSVNPNPALGGTGTTTLTDPATTTGVFTIPASGLNAGAEYSFVAYVTNGVGTSYTSPVSTFTTLALPTLGALSLPNVFDTLALAGSSVVADGGTPVTGRGFVISATAANSNPQLGGTGVTEIAGGSGTGVFSRSIGPLLPATEYSVAAYATSAAGTAYTAVSTFTTAAGPTTSLAAGDLAFTGYNGTTTPERISFVLLKSVAIGTSVLLTDNGWNEAVAPPAFNTNEGLYQLGFAQDFPAGSRFFYDSATVSFTDFSGSATGLISRVTGNTGFSNSGDQLTAIQGTLAAPSAFLAQISSGAFVTSGTLSTQTTYLAPGLAVGTTAISLNAANGNGVLNSADADVGTNIVDTAAGIRGIVNAVSNWTVNTSSTLVVPPDISFSVTPTVTVSAATDVTDSTATLNGSTVSAGQSEITERGFVYSLTSENSNPQIGGANTTKVTVRSTTDVFSGNITGLSSSSGYSFVAYAINSAGTGYSNVQTLTTSGAGAVPTLGDLSVPHLFDTLLSADSEVSTDGGAAVTARGFVISRTTVNDNPRINGTGVTEWSSGTGTGDFSTGIGGLLPGTQYSIAGYATNSVGTAYTSVATITTSAGSGTSLALGGLAFTGYNGRSAAERFSFVLIRPVAVGTSVLFTDNGWNGSLSTPAFATQEAEYQLGFTQAFSAGTQFYYDAATGQFAGFGGSTAGLVSSVAGTPGFSDQGDQLTAIQGPLAAPAGFAAQFSSSSFITTGSPSENTTWLAPGLINGSTAFTLDAATVNGVLNSGEVGATVQGSPASVRSIVHNAGNWVTTPFDNLTVPPAITFVIETTSLTSFDVQLGQTQRSWIRYLDLLFSRATELDSLILGGRFQLTNRGLNGDLSSPVSLTPAMFSRTNAAVRLDFGTSGLGGNRNTNAGDGYYELAMDLDSDGSFETRKYFYRLLGDVNGDRRVDSTDSSLVLNAFSSRNPEYDVNGDGFVNAVDRTLVLRANLRKLKDGLLVDD
jgi:hypothetical protein